PQLRTDRGLDWEAGGLHSFRTEGRITGQSQLENPGNAKLELPPAYAWDGAVSWHMTARHSLEVRGSNVTNSKRYGSRYGGSDTPYYYVLPPRNVFVTLQLGF